MRAAARASRQLLDDAARQDLEADPTAARESRERALDQVARAHRWEPDDIEINLLLAQALLVLGRPNQARVKALRVLEREPRNSRAHFGAGLALLNLGRQQQAFRHLERATQLEPQFTSPWDAWAGALRQEGQLQAALSLLDRTVRANPTYLEAHVQAGEILIELGDLERALRRYVDAVRLAQQLGTVDDQVRVLFRTAVLRLELQLHREALDDLDGIVDLFDQTHASANGSQPRPLAAKAQPGPADDLRVTWATYTSGWALCSLKRYDDAVERFEWTQRGPEPFPFLAPYASAAARWRQGRYRESWRRLGDAPLPRPTDPALVHAVGVTLRLRGDYTGASHVFEAGINEWPDDPYMWRNLVDLYLERRHAEPQSSELWYWRARQASKRAEGLFEDQLATARTPDTLLALGSLLLSLEEYEAAKGHLEAALALRPRDDLTHANLGLVHLSMGDPRRAATYFLEALRLNPDNLYFQVALADAHLQLKQLEQAEDGYRGVLLTAPGHVEALIGLGDVLTARGDAGEPELYAEAEESFLEARDLARKTESPRLRDRPGSTGLYSRQWAALHYALGYVYVKQYEADAGGPLAIRDSKLLDRARDAFKLATEEDRTLIRAVRAHARLTAEKRRSRRRRVSVLLPLLAVVLLLLVQFSYYWERFPPEASLAAASYITLTFGLLAFLIAAVSLPDLLKLRLGGIALEKTAAEQAELPERFAIPHDPRLAGLMRNLQSFGPPTQAPPSRASDAAGPRVGGDQGMQDAKRAWKRKETSSARRGAGDYG